MCQFILGCSTSTACWNRKHEEREKERGKTWGVRVLREINTEKDRKREQGRYLERGKDKTFEGERAMEREKGRVI